MSDNNLWAIFFVCFTLIAGFGIKSCADYAMLTEDLKSSLAKQEEEHKVALQTECLKNNPASECRKLFVTTTEVSR